MELKCLTHYNAIIRNNIYRWMQIILDTLPTISPATMSDNISNKSKELFSQPTNSRTSSKCRCHDDIGNLFNQPIKHSFLFLVLSPSQLIQQQTMMKVVVTALGPNYASHGHNDIMICTDGQNKFFCANQAAQMSRAMRSRFFSQSTKVYQS